MALTKNDGVEFEGRLILHAPNVHVGGGANLLNALARDSGIASRALLLKDTRMKIDPSIAARIKTHNYIPTLLSRFQAERDLRSKTHPGDVVLAFGNLPPIYRLSCKTVLFVQNRYLVDPEMPTNDFSFFARARIASERLWLRLKLKNVDLIFVQTESMALLIKKNLARDAEVFPFSVPMSRRVVADAVSAPCEKLYDFIYVSSGEPHKNHDALLDAWALLAVADIRPRLAVTLAADRHARLAEKVNAINASYATDIINLGAILPERVESVYREARALVFPSLGESFGLPLIEASNLGLPIVASERDYVRDVANPVETFDPKSPRSIAHAIRRYLKLQDDQHNYLDAREFLHHVCFFGT